MADKQVYLKGRKYLVLSIFGGRRNGWKDENWSSSGVGFIEVM